MKSIPSELESSLESLYSKGNSIVFTGIGNVLKRDDGIGVYISRKLKASGRIQILTVEQSIENYIGKINSLKPEILILIDCVNFHKNPGYAEILVIDKIQDQTSNTHNISLVKISELFAMPVYILGIQPKDISFGEGLSSEVKDMGDNIVYLINSAR